MYTIHICLYIYVYIQIYIYIYMYLYIHVYTYVYTNISMPLTPVPIALLYMYTYLLKIYMYISADPRSALGEARAPEAGLHRQMSSPPASPRPHGLPRNLATASRAHTGS